jgi:RNA polymerase sigma-70 factor (ECF subfamily)
MTLLLDGRPQRLTIQEAATRESRRPSGDERPVRESFFSGTIRSLTDRLTVAARRIVDDEELARDAVQEALLSLWLQAELPANPRAWLVRTVRNRCLHLARGRSRRLKHETCARRLRLEASDRDDPAERLEREEWGRIFSDSLNRLGKDQRTILALNLIDELDYRSIAVVLDVPIGTVRSRLSRARRALRDVLTRTLPEEGPSRR